MIPNRRPLAVRSCSTPFGRGLGPPATRTGLALLATVAGLAVLAPPAYAQDQADLALVPVSSQVAHGVTAARAKPFRFAIDNTRGTAAATEVVVTVDVSALDPTRVGYLVPANCRATGHALTCALGSIPAGTSSDFGLPVFTTGDGGPAGALTVAVTSATVDPDLDDNAASVEVTVADPGYDVTAWAADVRIAAPARTTARGSSGPAGRAAGPTAPLDWAVVNHGSEDVPGLVYGISLPPGVVFDRVPADCVRQQLAAATQLLCDRPDVVLHPGQRHSEPVTVRLPGPTAARLLTPGVVFAAGLMPAPRDRAGRPSGLVPSRSPAVRNPGTETDPADNQALFDVFVTDPVPASTGAPAGGAGGGQAGGALPVTGVSIGPLALLGLATLLAGGALVLLSRRHRSTD